jgi:hypothetical protein
LTTIIIATVTGLLLLTAPLVAGQKEDSPYKGLVPHDSAVFIAPMEGGLDGFIAAELLKQKVPVKIVTEEALATFVMSGISIKADDHWYNVIWGGKDKNEGNVRLLNVKDKTMVWAGEAGDRSLWWGNLKRGGQRKVADRIVRKMKKDLF